ncbi:MAG: hypothetical protein IPN46_15080 [Saprospiraceae bacterium]|nr:hypothetical protein [Saprospiraceae bacterium]
MIASILNEKGLLVANEIIKNRAYTLKYNLSKEGYSNVIVTNNDPKDFSHLTSFFDIILVDAPCSGEGMFRKDPNAIGEWSPENVKNCSLRQQKIIHDVMPALKPDGYLIYSTCTYNDAYLKLIYCGTSVGLPIKNILIPDHSLALSLNRSIEINTIEMDTNTALKYLKKDLYAVEHARKGWLLATYKRVKESVG